MAADLVEDWLPAEVNDRLTSDLRRITIDPRLRLSEDWIYSLDGETYQMVLPGEPIPDANRSGAMVPGGVAIDFPSIPADVLELAIDVAAAQVVSAVHEAIEWTTVDGERIADPHPSNADEMWTWLAQASRSLVHEYVARFGPTH